MEIVTEGAFTLGGGLTFKSQNPRRLRIFSITFPSSTKSEDLHLTLALRAGQGIILIDYLLRNTEGRQVDTGLFAGHKIPVCVMDIHMA
jgi:hypothetical protein